MLPAFSTRDRDAQASNDRRASRCLSLDAHLFLFHPRPVIFPLQRRIRFRKRKLFVVSAKSPLEEPRRDKPESNSGFRAEIISADLTVAARISPRDRIIYLDIVMSTVDSKISKPASLRRRDLTRDTCFIRFLIRSFKCLSNLAPSGRSLEFTTRE